VKKKDSLYLTQSVHSKYLDNSFTKRLLKKFDKIFPEIKNEVKNSSKTLSILNDKFKFNFKIQDLKKFKKFKNIVLIGMGGSVLGSEAIFNFFEEKIKKKIYFFDNLNEKKMADLKKSKTNKTLFIVISKSGDTIETLSNLFLLNILKKNAKNIIIISEKKNNLLFNVSKKFNLFFVEHKNYIGGRYSVLSEVGVLPAYLMGVNVIKLRSNIQDWITGSEKKILKKNAIMLANLLNEKKYNNLIFINYSPELEKFLYWCQQLIAESLGKKNKGFLPLISNAPKDHHSLLQLYLDGPRDKLFYIFSLEKNSKETIKISQKITKNYFLNNKKLGKVKIAQKEALTKSFKQKNIPFREFKLKKKDEKTLGKLFSYFILETILIGKLLKINPFDQPAVEQVKIFTKKFLK
jgi:glucose-6-phosphate isomerase